MLATIQVLEEELKNYKKRVSFLEQYITYLNSDSLDVDGNVINTKFEDIDKAYRLENELSFKKSLIKQRESQIKQISEQEELKVKAAEQMPELIEKSKEVYNCMLDDLDKLKKAKKTKEIKDAIKMVEMQVDEVSDLIDGIEARLNEAKGDSILNDFRQINNILKLRE